MISARNTLETNAAVSYRATPQTDRKQGSRRSAQRSAQVSIPEWSSSSVAPKKRRQNSGPSEMAKVHPIDLPPMAVKSHHRHSASHPVYPGYISYNGGSGVLSSDSIPLPKTHIQRTPSELQLADDMRTAEFQDVRMYARLLVGMQSRIQNQCIASGGYVHPLSRKSLHGIIMTKQGVNDVNGDYQVGHGNDVGAEFIKVDDGWDVNYIDEETSTVEGVGEHVVKSPSDCSISTLSHNADQIANYVTPHDSLTGYSCNVFSGDEVEDDCVFSLEL